MTNVLQRDAENISALTESVQRYAAEYLQRLNAMPTDNAESFLPQLSLPETGWGAASTMTYIQEKMQSLFVASPGARYWGYVTGGVTPAALMGDWITSTIDQNTQSLNGPGDMTALVEQQTIGMIRELLDLPAHFMGGFVSGATMSNFTCLAVARQWAGARAGNDIAREGLVKAMSGGESPVVLSATPHSSSLKALSMLGLGSSNVVIVDKPSGREALDVKHLEALLQEHEGKHVILISSGGTVNTVDYDEMLAIRRLRERYRFWWHIDAAFGAFAACSPAHKHLLAGWEEADSITVDCHKWLNVPYDSAVFFVHERYAALQMQTFQNSSAPYLGNPADNFSYLNFVPENSRRFRALPAWCTLVAYGKEGYREIVERNIALARQLGERISASTTFALQAPVRLNVVCFSVKDLNGTQLEREAVMGFLDTLNHRGKVFMTPTLYNGVWCLRAALVNWQTQQEDVEVAWNELTEVYQEVFRREVRSKSSERAKKNPI
ncbi:MAG: aspartate aminotransferase family protein [Ignavibacteria bacterium]|nr:aspartate aminotransferase family protein [Ignavibacteria bacterium]